MLLCLIKERDGVGWNKKREREREKNENVCTEIFRLLNFVIRGKKTNGGEWRGGC